MKTFNELLREQASYELDNQELEGSEQFKAMQKQFCVDQTLACDVESKVDLIKSRANDLIRDMTRLVERIEEQGVNFDLYYAKDVSSSARDIERTAGELEGMRIVYDRMLKLR